MEIFFTYRVEAGVCLLDKDESVHCVRVLRHREGDEISVIDGRGTLYSCELLDASPTGASARIVSEQRGWGSHPYRLRLACCPTKNPDRYEWMAEKSTELGVDEIIPVIGDHSERKVFKKDRLERIVLSAAKQSLKGAVPAIAEPLSVRAFVESQRSSTAVKMICCCFEGEVPRQSVMDVLPVGETQPEIIVLIGPEGDFSREEAALAVEAGFVPVHLGPSRLRTETAALTAVEAAYLRLCTLG